MTLHFTIGCWILLFLTPGYTPVFAEDEVIRVLRGSDATLHCRSETSLPPKWEWGSKQRSTSINIKTLVVNNTAYLLVENFQKINKGNYRCVHGTKKKFAVKLEIQMDITNTTPVYRISRTGSLHLFCEHQLQAKLQGFWSWRQTGSEGDCKRSGSDLEHFGNRSEVKSGHKNKSLSISPLLWNDSGQYRCTLCDGDKLHKQCTYEIITVKVYSEPVELTEGEDGSLVCAVSHLKESTRLLWIDTQSQQMFSNPEARAPAGEFRLVVRNVTLVQSAWECAVFHQGHLRALVPFTLTVKSRATQPPGPPAGGEGARVTDRPGQDPTAAARNPSGNHPIYLSLVCLSGLLVCVGTAFIIHCCRRRQDPIQPPPPTLLPTQPSAKGDEQTPDDDGAVHYAAVHFKMKKEADSSTPATLATDNLTPEEDSVIYADVVLATGIRR